MSIVSIKVYSSYYLISKEFNVHSGDDNIILNNDNLTVDLNSIEIIDPSQSKQPIISRIQLPQSYEDYKKYSSVKITTNDGKSIYCKVLQVTADNKIPQGYSELQYDQDFTLKVLETSTEIMDIKSSYISSLTPLDDGFIDYFNAKSAHSIQIKTFGISDRIVKVTYKCTMGQKETNVSSMANQFSNLNFNYRNTPQPKSLANFKIKLDITLSTVDIENDETIECTDNNSFNDLFLNSKSVDIKFNIAQSLQWIPPFTLENVPVEFKILDPKTKKTHTVAFESLSCSYLEEYVLPLASLVNINVDRAKLIKPQTTTYSPYFIFKNTSDKPLLFTGVSNTLDQLFLMNTVLPNSTGLLGFNVPFTSSPNTFGANGFNNMGGSSNHLNVGADLIITTKSPTLDFRLDQVKVIINDVFYNYHKLITSTTTLTNLSSFRQVAIVKIQTSDSTIPELTEEFEYICDDNDTVFGGYNTFKLYQIPMDPYSCKSFPFKIRVPFVNTHINHKIYIPDLKLEILATLPGVTYDHINDTQIYNLDYSNNEIPEQNQFLTLLKSFKPLFGLTNDFTNIFGQKDTNVGYNSNPTFGMTSPFGQPINSFGSGFGNSSQPSTTYGFGFGANNFQASNGSPFGQPINSFGSGFGTSSQPSTTSGFGLGSTPATGFGFGGNIQPSNTPCFGVTPNAASVGDLSTGFCQTSTQASNTLLSDYTPTSTTTNLFAGQQPTTTTATSSLFGSTQPNPTTTTTTAASLFGQTQPRPPPQATSLFGQVTPTPSNQTQSTSLFGQAIHPSQATPIFGQASPTPSNQTQSTSLFGQTQPTHATSLFGQVTPTPSNQTQSTSLFGQAIHPPQSTSLFGQTQPTHATSLFGQTQPTPFGQVMPTPSNQNQPPSAGKYVDGTLINCDVTYVDERISFEEKRLADSVKLKESDDPNKIFK